MTPKQIELQQEPEKDVGEVSGYCFYMSKLGQSCNDACMEQVAGQCDAAGTEFAAHSVERCQNVVKGFGGLVVGKGVKSENDRSGCTYSDTGKGSKVQLMKKDDLYPLCSEKHDIARSHRVCACLPTLGDFNLFKETVGPCKGGDGAQNKIRTGTFRSAAQCQDECTRDSKCGAFAYVHPWDGSDRVCNFYGENHAGDNSNKHIRCHVKDAYLTTIGKCKQYGAKTQKKAGKNIKLESVEECKAACDAKNNCKAYQVQEPFKTTCKLFTEGHTGDGEHGKLCYTKAMSGVKPVKV